MKHRHTTALILSLCTLALSPSVIAAPAAKTQEVVSPQTLQKAVDSLHNEIQTVANSIPQQLVKQQALHQKQIAELEKRLQERMELLQKQIKQVQYNLTKEVKTVQKELEQLNKATSK